jgi:taurine--2-oxoglutarate transaminase
MGELLAAMKSRGVLPFANFNRLHVVPPCTVSDAEVKEGLAVLDEAFGEIDQHYVGA